MNKIRIFLLVAAGAIALGDNHHAHAEPSPDDKALATMLFQDGRMLLAAGKMAEACLKFAESQRLDPGGGTLLNLALCHEREGRLARSWSEYKEAANVARRDGRRDRESEAILHIEALEPRLSRLTIVVPAGTQVDGLVIERDGQKVGPGAWSTAIPVDGGPHTVRATAPGREPFATTILMGIEADHQVVEIPVLATPVVVVSSPRESTPTVPVISPVPTVSAFTPARMRWAGVGAAGVGVILLATAGLALASALDAKTGANSECFVDGCTEVGLRKRHDAVSRGNTATLLGISGAVLVGTGATFFYLAHRTRYQPNVRQQTARTPTRFMLGMALGPVISVRGEW